MVDDGMGELWDLFEEEANTSLAVMEACLLSLEEDASQPARVAELYRMLHSMKGSGRLMGIAPVEAVGHAAEELVEQARDGAPLRQAHIEALLQATDALRSAAQEAVSTRSGGSLEHVRTLVKRLETLGEDMAAEPVAAAEASTESPPPQPQSPPLLAPDPPTRFPDDLLDVDRIDPATDPEYVKAFLQVAEEQLGPISAALNDAVSGAPEAAGTLREGAAGLQHAARQMGYGALDAALDGLLAWIGTGEVESARASERVVVGELVRIQEAAEGQAGSPERISSIADLYGEWHMSRAYGDLARLSEILASWSHRPPAAEREVVGILERLQRTAAYCEFAKAGELAAVLTDAFLRAAQGDEVIDDGLVSQAAEFVTFFSATLEEDEVEATAAELSSRVKEGLDGDVDARAAVSWIGEAHRGLSASGLEQIGVALAAGENFFHIWMDLEEDAEAADGFYDWLQSVRLITSTTGDPGFDFVVSTVETLAGVQGALASVDPLGGRVRSTLLRPKVADEPPRPEAARVAAPPPTPDRASDTGPAASTTGPGAGGDREPQRGGRFIRVEAARVSHLLDLAGEIGLAVGAVLNHPGVVGGQLEGFSGLAHRAEGLIGELQDVSATLRLVPVSTVFNRMARLVRDLSLEFGKSVRFETVGGDTEIDKVVVDGLYDPLVHMVRNAIDHGIELPEVRRAKGKPERATITLTAAQRGGEILIEVQDDGAGLDRERIVARARARGLLGPDEDPGPDEAVWRYILQPGFSTAETVSSISGRGVGMDVVRADVHRLRGRTFLRSEAGRGTTIAIHLPLTLAFMEGLALRVADHVYIVPADVFTEVVQIPREDVLVNAAAGSQMFSSHGQLVPLCWLQRFYNGPPIAELPANLLCAVVQSGGRDVAIPVDEILGYLQVTMKPLPRHLESVRAVVGVGLMRSGDIALALDCEQLLHATE